MKNLILISAFCTLFWGCAKEILNPECPHPNSLAYFTGNVAGEKICFRMPDEHINSNFSSYSGGGFVGIDDWAYRNIGFLIGRNLPTDTLPVYVNIFVDKILESEYTLESVEKVLTVGKKPFQNVLNDPTPNIPGSGGFHGHGFGVEAYTPNHLGSIYNNFYLGAFSYGGPQDEGSILEITSVKKIDANKFDVTFFVRCKLYDTLGRYVGMLEDGELRGRYYFEP
jgi:hypothetical protein